MVVVVWFSLLGYLAKDVVVVVIETSLKDSFNTKYDDDVVVKVKSPSVEEDEQKDHKKTSSTFFVGYNLL